MQRVAPRDKFLRTFLEMWVFTPSKNPSKEKSNSESILTLKRGLEVKIVRDKDF